MAQSKDLRKMNREMQRLLDRKAPYIFLAPFELKNLKKKMLIFIEQFLSARFGLNSSYSSTILNMELPVLHQNRLKVYNYGSN